MAQIITDANAQDIIGAGLPVVIDFSAAWCGPCKMLSPIIDELAAEYEGKVNVCKCDVDESEKLAAKFGVRNIPFVVFIKDGNVVDRSVGAVPKATLQQKLNALL